MIRFSAHRCRVLFATAGALAWMAVLRGPYHFDDMVTPVTDPASQSIGAWMEYLARTLRPLAKLTYALEASVGLSSAPSARRLISVLILAVSAALLCLVMQRLGASRPLAVAGSWLWAVHPIQADSVLAVAGRPCVLANCLVLGALLAMLKRRHVLAAGLFAGAVLARETAMAAIFPLAVAEIASGKGKPLQHLKRLEPVACVLLLGAAWLLVHPRYEALADFSFHARVWSASTVAQVAAIPLGFSLFLRPWALSLDHGEALPTSPSSPLFLLGVALYAAMAVGLWLALRRRRPGIAVGLALVIASLIPTQSIVPKLDPLTERPLSGVLAGLMLVAVACAGRRATRSDASGARWWRLRLFAVIAATLWMGAATIARGALYASDVDLWESAAHLSVAKARPHFNFALALVKQGRMQEAARAAARAAQLDPFDSEMTNLAQGLSVWLR
jgi:hypothetical protein